MWRRVSNKMGKSVKVCQHKAKEWGFKTGIDDLIVLIAPKYFDGENSTLDWLDNTLSW